MAKSKNIIPIYLAVVLLSLSSCTSYYSTVIIENATAGKEELPEYIRSLTIMNRSMSDKFKNHDEDSLQKHFYKNGFQLSMDIYDSLAADTTIKALAELLFESGRYEDVVPVNRNIKRPLPPHQLPDPLDWEYVSEKCSLFHTDALIVLEQFSTKVISDYSSEKAPYYNFGEFVKSYYASIDIQYDGIFRVYYPKTKQIVSDIRLSDTIYWDSFDYSQVGLFNNLPSVKQAVINAGIKLALDVDDRISPSWEQEKRGYFLFERKNDKGKELVNQGKWDEAATFWKSMAESKNKRIRSKAEFNLALVNELDGNLPKAIEWGVKSYYTLYRIQTDNYLKQLKKRKEALEKQ